MWQKQAKQKPCEAAQGNPKTQFLAAFLFLFSFAAERKEAAGGMKRRTDSHASDVGHWLGMTPLRGVRGDAPQGYLLRGERWAAFTQGRLDATALPWHTGRCGHRPLRKDKRCDVKMDGGRDTPRVLVPPRSTAWASPPTEGLSRVGSFNIQKEAPGGRFLLHILSPFYLLCG